MIRRWTTALLLAAGVVAASTVQAQLANSARERYDQRSRGKDIDDFVKKLQSSDPEDRLQGVKFLGESNEPGAIEYLVEAVGDEDVRVSAKAIDMLAHMRAAEASPVLIQYLFLRTTDPQMKNRVLAALGKIGDARAAKPIVDFLRRDLDPDTCGTAIFALGEIGAPEAEETLQRYSKKADSATIRRLAREALAKVHQHQAQLSAEAKEPEFTFLRRDEEQPPQR